MVELSRKVRETLTFWVTKAGWIASCWGALDETYHDELLERIQ